MINNKLLSYMTLFVIVNICQGITIASDDISDKSTNNSTSPVSEHKTQGSVIILHVVMI
ncbi:MAG: hypothetical protein IJU54_00845 [Alphaproteobacteria bacterium]|nr:hypothetical protein [Alphaproteobacteria bacterium]